MWAFGLRVEKEVGSWLGKEDHAYSQPGWLSYRRSLPADSLCGPLHVSDLSVFLQAERAEGTSDRKFLPASSVANDIWMLLFVGRLFRAIPGSAEVCSLFEVWDILFSQKTQFTGLGCYHLCYGARSTASQFMD